MLSRKTRMQTARAVAAFVLLLSHLGSAFHFAQTAHTLETFFPGHGCALGHDHVIHLEPHSRIDDRSQSSILESGIAIRAEANRQCLFASYLFNGSRSILPERTRIGLEPEKSVFQGFRTNKRVIPFLLYQLAPKHSPPYEPASTA